MAQRKKLGFFSKQACSRCTILLVVIFRAPFICGMYNTYDFIRLDGINVLKIPIIGNLHDDSIAVWMRHGRSIFWDFSLSGVARYEAVILPQCDSRFNSCWTDRSMISLQQLGDFPFNSCWTAVVRSGYNGKLTVNLVAVRKIVQNGRKSPKTKLLRLSLSLVGFVIRFSVEIHGNHRIRLLPVDSVRMRQMHPR